MGAIQGAYLLTSFRLNHKDAPYPKSPSRGLVIVSPKDSNSTNELSEGNKEEHSLNIRNLEDIKRKAWNVHRKWFDMIQSRSVNNSNDNKKDHDRANENGSSRLAFNPEPLRIFIVGDSLAAGVGSTSGTPILPEAIARSLSKAMGGRPVHWTCYGTPGASTSRIRKDIHKLSNNDDEINEKQADDTAIATSPPANLQVDDCIKNPKKVLNRLKVRLKSKLASSLITEEDDNELEAWNLWNSSLSPQRQDSSSANSAPSAATECQQQQHPHHYDVVIVLTGLNDLKSIFLPFLQDGDGLNTNTFKEELRKLFHSLTGNRKSNKLQHGNEREGNDNKETLVVIPALPARVSPLFQYPPLSFFLPNLFDFIDGEKRSLSQEYPNRLLFVEAPTIQMIDEIEKGQYFLCAKRKTETVLLALKDVTRRVRNDLERLMKKHTQYHDFRDNKETKEIELHYEASRNDNLTSDVDTDVIGSKLVSVDRVHPNNEGYDFWGRHIAEGIIQQLHSNSDQ